MDWVLPSLLSAVAFTVLTIVQKRILQRHVHSAVVFNALAALPQFAVAVVILLLWPPDWSTSAVKIMLGAGVIQATVWLLQSYAINREVDISRIVPVLDSFPLPVLIIAVVALGETLTPLKWVAALMVIAGAILASAHQAMPGERIRMNRSLFAIIGAMMAMAVMTILFKIVSTELTAFQMIALTWLVSAPIHLGISRVTHVGPAIRTALRSPSAVGMMAASQIAMFIAIIAGLIAITIGPVSLSTAIMSTRPVMLLIWAVASGFSVRDVLRREPQRGGMRSKWASASLVTVGVGVMAF